MDLEADFLSWLKGKAGEMSSADGLFFGIGDDCSVIDRGDVFELVEHDLITEGNHFLPKWSSPQEIGMKAIESNVSDIASMGGAPRYVVTGITLPRDLDLEYIKAVYSGILSACKKYDIALIGGDTTSGQSLTIAVTLIGEVEKQSIVYRGGAKKGDVLCVTGPLGASMAGFRALNYLEVEGLSLQEFLSGCSPADRSAFTYCIDRHLRPQAQLEVGRLLADCGVNAMIDVSDGLASEARHIARESGLKVRLDEGLIVVDERVARVARHLHLDPLDFVLSGGEDFELLFAVSKKKIESLFETFESMDFPFPEAVGELLSHDSPHDEFRYTIVRSGGQEEDLPQGYVHFG